MGRKTWLTITLGLMAAILSSACAPAARPLTKITIGIPGEALTQIPMYIAREKGFYAEQGLEADIILQKGGADVMKVLVSGDIDFGVITSYMVETMKEQGRDARLVLVMVGKPPFSLIARQELGLKGVADLKGRTIGITSPGSLSHGLTKYVVSKYGLNPEKDVVIQPMGGLAEEAAALKAKRLDAAMISEPWTTTLVKEGVVIQVADTIDEVAGYLNTPLASRKDYIDKNKETVKRLRAAIRKSLSFIQGDREETLRLAQKLYPSMTEESIRPSLDRLFRAFSKDGDISRELLKSSQDLDLKMGFTSKASPYEEVVFAER